VSFIGTIQTGPGADTYRSQAPGIFQVGASAVINTGTPMRRNVTAVQGQTPGAYNFTPTVPGIVGGDQVVGLNQTGGGDVYGIYGGQTVNNTSTGATATSTVTGSIVRAGITPVLVGTASGGIAVKVGDQVGMSSLISGGLGILAHNIAAPVPFAQNLIFPASQGLIGTVVGYPITTALVSAVNSGTSVAAPVTNIAGFGIGAAASPALTINPGAANAEVVTFSSVGPGVCATNNMTFGGSSAGTDFVIMTIGNASTGAIPAVPGGIVAVSIPLTASQTAAANATQAASAINAVFQNLGGAPPNIPGIGGIQPFGVATAATSIVTITAAVPSPLYSVVPVSWVIQGASSFASGGTSLGAVSAGAFPTTFGTFINNHQAGEPVIGVVATFGATICAIPQPGGVNVALALVDVESLV
jgi:hypothetical protein